MPNYYLSVFAFSFLLAATSIHASTENERKPYIVYMGETPAAKASLAVEHHNLLLAAIGNEKIARESRIYSYGKSFNGFAARLLPHEAKRLSENKGVVSVFASTRRKLHTTRSWDFLGMPLTLKQRKPRAESNIIVGVLDTGIWVEAPSFSDKGYRPAPAKWKGKCVKGTNFTGCNKKVIGAKYYNLESSQGPFPVTDEPSPVDTEGHGTHTSSTVAGVPVKGASLYGLAEGTARGGAPYARIAAYKVCWSEGCSDLDILAGFDEAIYDGVDLISVSIGGPSRDFFQDAIAIGAFHAMKKGILTSCSAGNDGPSTYTVQNVAPWIFTVAATSIDRQFETAIKLGNGLETSGIAVNTFSPRKAMYPLTNGAHATNLTENNPFFYGNISACDYGTLSEEKVKGKIVYCLGNSGQDSIVKDLGAAGAIMSTDTNIDVAFATLIMGTIVISKNGMKIDKYINSTKNPTAVVHKSRTVNITAPFVASFSSRGPQSINRNILKPDIAAPGLSILAAYSTLTSITGEPSDNRHVPFNIVSGTSMSCPHVAAAAAYVKSFHPDWSPAAIKSALMTTATPMKIPDASGELGSGSGQINPVKAVHPGLIYDIPASSYIRFLCKEGYNSTTIRLLNGDKKNYSCSSFKPAEGTDGLNYPSMHLQLNSMDSTISAVFHRTVTYVGYGNSVYKANVKSPTDVSIQVIPKTLKFSRSHEKQSFKVVVKGDKMKTRTQILSATLEWSDSKHSVKSPILIYKPEQTR